MLRAQTRRVDVGLWRRHRPSGHPIGKINPRTHAAAKPPFSCDEFCRQADAPHAADAGLGIRRTSHLARAIDHAARGRPNSLMRGLVHQRRPSRPLEGRGSGCEPGWRGIWAIGHVDVSRGVRAPKSEKGYTTPRSDFRFLLNRSQWRDRAGFAPASTSRMRAFYFRILFRHYQVGAPDDLSARRGSVRACACLSCPP